MSSINRVILIGNVGKDGEVKTFPSGDQFMEFSLATNESYKDKSGQWKDITQWHQVKVLNSAKIKFLGDRVRKGAKLYIEGQVEYRSWEQDGQKRYMTEIVVPKFGGDVKVMEKHGGSTAPQSGGDDGWGDSSPNDDVPF
jgi:single-strand DNA-binding protein